MQNEIDGQIFIYTYQTVNNIIKIFLDNIMINTQFLDTE